ncbi:MAG: HD domain-containing protein, partial [Terracidiphilus sp.]
MAHLILVHDAAATLVEKIAQAFPNLQLDRDLILFGAATHDLGKTTVREELSRSGKQHQSLGVDLLKSLGVSEE